MLTLSLILLVPYFVWGVVSLHRKFLLHEEWPLGIELATMAGLIGFYAVALPTLRPFLADNPGLLVFSGLGLFVSTFALYGHIMISVASRFLVDIVMTPDDSVATAPRLGPAESLERAGDHAGAYAEYLVLARMYPNLSDLKLRLAEVCLKLGRDGEAADWLDHALLRMEKPSDHAMAAVRLAEIAEKKLGDNERAKAVLRTFIERHPDHEDTRLLTERLGRVGVEHAKEARPSGLDAMQDKPMGVEDDIGMPTLPETTRMLHRSTKKPATSGLVPLGEDSLTAEPVPDEEAPRADAGTTALQPLEELPDPEPEAAEPEQSGTPSLGLEKMLDADEERNA
jgi:tetratricopeptide (TPR) repeat protein